MIFGRPGFAYFPVVALNLVLALAVELASAADPWRLELLPTVIGAPSSAIVQPGDTLLDIAFGHRVGFAHLERMNPEVDVWIPAPGTVVRLPSEMIPPRGSRVGLVVNLPEMRLYDFTAPGSVSAFPVAIGDAEDPTPIGEFPIGAKRIDPVWFVPESIRAERPELPARVPAGPENPLGDRWMTLGGTSYGIHGTNNRWSIGRTSTHGCIRLYEDAARELYDRVPSGTPVTVVYQPVIARAQGRGPLPRGAPRSLRAGARSGLRRPRAPPRSGAVRLDRPRSGARSGDGGARGAGPDRHCSPRRNARWSSYFLTLLLKIASAFRADASALSAALAAFWAALSLRVTACSATCSAA
jgi:L,D-transpeptidase ErfK/SrfK